MKAEQFIQDHTRNCCNEIGYCHNKTRNHNHVFYNWLTPDHARMAVKIAREEVIVEVLKWLRNNYRNYMHNPTGEKLEAFFGGDMITDLEKELEKGV